MTLCRALAFAAVLVGISLQQAAAQFGGMPGMPGSPGGFSAPQAAPPPACQKLLAMRDELQKHGNAINAASQRKATSTEACKLFRAFIAAEIRMIKAVEQDGPQCGVPPAVHKQMKDGHAKAQGVAKNVCDAAARGAQPAGPSLSDALGTTPTVPDKRSGTTFDTLTGNPLQR